MAQNNNRQQTFQDLSETRKKRKELPVSFKFAMFFCLGWSYIGVLLYSIGAFSFAHDIVDQFIRWSCGFFGAGGIAFVIIGNWILESN